jgi:hypothetical protein
MNSIFMSILAFLLMLFPGCGFLQGASFPGVQVVMDNIVTSVETRNVSSLEDMMCQYIKKNVPNLASEIDKLFATIDGEIIESDWNSSSSYDSSVGGGISRKDSSVNGSIQKRSWEVIFSTTTDSYRLDITWIVINSRVPDEVGMRSMSLSDDEGNSLATTYVPKS